MGKLLCPYSIVQPNQLARGGGVHILHEVMKLRAGSGAPGPGQRGHGWDNGLGWWWDHYKIKIRQWDSDVVMCIHVEQWWLWISITTIVKLLLKVLDSARGLLQGPMKQWCKF